tara:strand:- start:4426 stop:4638 length:213 start_codon:yes stop_codon:yes gene_type:complete
MKDLFKIGDLVRDTSLKPDKNRGYGVVLDILPVQYEKINSIKCAWYSGENTWVKTSQLKLISRGQNGEPS